MSAYKLLDTLFRGGEIKSNVGMSVDASYPTGVGREMTRLSGNLPDTLSEGEYWQMEQRSAEIAMSALLVTQAVKLRQMDRGNLTKIRGAILQDKQGAMRSALTVGQQDVRFQEAAIQYNILGGGQQHRATGYAAAAAGTRTWR